MEQPFLAAAGISSLGLVILLLVVGVVSMGVELFVLPGFGVAGILGGLCFLAGGIAAWVQYGALWGALAVAGTVTVTVVMIVVTLRSRALRKRLVLEAQLQSGGGTEAQDLSDIIGKTGKTRTVLRPAGIADIDDRRIDVVSQGGYIEKDVLVKVVEIDGPRVIVTQTD